MHKATSFQHSETANKLMGSECPFSTLILCAVN